MHARRARRARALIGGALVALGLLAASCSTDDTGSSTGDSTSDDSSPDATGEAAPLRAAFDPDAVGELTIAPPANEGLGATILGPGGLDLTSVGYEQEELFVSGTASSYLSAEPLSEDGEWTVAPDAEAAFTTRAVVRRPADAADFNGNVIIEWLNVSGGLDADADWVFTHTELVREGWAWIGVSAQVVGIEGNGGIGDVLALKVADPERYGELVHPGDDFSYDMFSQVGAAVRTQPGALLGDDLAPEQVLAMGESQSAFRLTTYANAVAPLANVYDGYLIHARSDSGADLNAAASPPQEAPSPTFVRADLDVPVLVVSSETDLLGLDYVRARQDDTDLFRGWEIAGTAHADAYSLGIGDTDDGSEAADTALFDAMLAPPDSIYGGVIACDSPLNSGPQTYVMRSAVHALDAWVRTGEPPPSMPRLEVDDAGTAFVLDEVGNATGGMRTPQVDAPVAVLSGLGQDGESFCGLFGTTVPLDAAALAEAYPDHDTFVSAWNESLDAAVEGGVILDADAEHLRTVAEQSNIGG